MHVQRVFYILCTLAILVCFGLYHAALPGLPPHDGTLPPHWRLLTVIGVCTFLAALVGLRLHFFLGRTNTNRTTTTLRSGATEASRIVEKGIRWWFFILPIPFYREIYSVKGASYEVEICNGETTKLESLGRQLDPASREGQAVLRLAEPQLGSLERFSDRGAPRWLS